MSDNSVTVIGNLTRDPELRFTPAGVPTATCGVAVNQRWQDSKNEWQEKTSFFDVVAWRGLAENFAELHRGDRVIIHGRLEHRSWEADDGSKRSKVEIVATDIGASLMFGTVEITKKQQTSAS